MAVYILISKNTGTGIIDNYTLMTQNNLGSVCTIDSTRNVYRVNDEACDSGFILFTLDTWSHVIPGISITTAATLPTHRVHNRE